MQASRLLSETIIASDQASGIAGQAPWLLTVAALLFRSSRLRVGEEGVR